MYRKFSFLVSFVLVLCLFGNAFGLVWGDKDIGNAAIPGSSSEAAGVWTILGSGNDIWGNADGFHYVYRPMSGDGSLQVNLVSMDLTDGWAKVGPMIRETTAAGSKHASTVMSGSNGIQMVWRLNTDGGSDGVTRGGESPPKEMRITRSGDELISEFNYEWLPGLFMWTEIGRIAVPMTADVTIGMAVCSHNNGALNTSVLDNVILTTAPYEKPWDLSPEDGATALPVTTSLSWMPGDSATSHDVYMGTDPAALPLVATKALGDESYTPPAVLMEATTYYWQIVEQPLGIASPVLSFKTERGGFGEIDYCIWWNIGGTVVTDLTNNPRYPDDPDECGILTQFDGPLNIADNFGGRIQGYLSPETSGNYTFWIASDDYSQLWLSTSEKGCEAQLIASVNGWTSHREYDKYASQKSVSIPLVADQKYFIRALWKEGGGGDSCTVAWEGPDSPSRSVVDGKFLMGGYVDAWASNLSLEDGQTYTPLEAEVLSFSPGAGAVAHNVYLGTDPAAMALVASVPMPDTSLNLGILAEGTYYLRVDADDGTTVAEGCPISFSIAEWVSMDIGRSNPDPAGSTSYDAGTGTYTLNATGSYELWGNADEFHYYYTTMKMTRDKGAIQARVLSINPPDSWRRAGVMIRGTRAANARKVMAHKTGHDNLRMQWRDNPGAGTGSSGDNWGLGFPRWVRLERDGNLYNGFRSPDGVNWTQLGSRNITMPNDYVLVGLALCHHPSQPPDQFTVGMFDNLTITTPDPRQAWGLDPEDGATMVDIHAVLRWNAGDGATEHRVYFSADEDAVVSRSPEVETILPAEVTELAVGPLDLGQVYYWCVDEVVNPVVPGEVVSFTAEEYRTIDDFEAYDVEPEALPEQQLIPGEILVEAVPPPDQAWVDPVTIVLDDGPQIVDDPARGLVLSLDGTGDYVDCGNPAELNFGTGDWTLSAWVKNTMTGTGDANKGGIIANGGDGGGGHRYCLILSEQQEGEVTLVVDDNAAKRQARGDATQVNDGAWHHILGLREGDQIRIYINGVEEGTAGLPAGYDLSGVSQRPVLIGAIYHHGSGDVYKDYEGLIDDVRIYDSALSMDGIAYLAEQGGTEPDASGLLGHWAFEGDFSDSSGNGFDGTPIGGESVNKCGYYGPLIAHYNFDEGAGAVAADSSGNGLDGTITDAVWTATTADGSAACLDFEGGANVVNDAAGEYLNYLSGMSISMWIQSDVIDTDKGFFIGRDPEGNDQRGIRYDTVGASSGSDDVIKFGVACTDGADESESSELIQKTDWEHVTVTWDNDGTGTQLWINGALNGLTFDGTNRTGLTSGYTKILVGKGSKDGAADAGWDGRIDDVRIYDYRLSEGEVRYLAGVGNIALPDRFVPLLAHYEFEGNYDDSSGNNRHGTPIGAGIAIEDDPDKGQVLSLPGGDNIFVEVGEVGIVGAMPRSIACWAKADHTSIPDWTLIFGFTTPGGGDNTHFNIGSLGGPGGVGAHVWGWEATIFNDTQALDWRHYAMTYNGNTVRYYGDGTQVGAVDRGALVNVDNVHIGSRITQASSFPGKVEDARIYDGVLTLGQIRTLADYTSTNPLSGTWSGRAAAAPALQYLGGAHEGSKCMRVEYTGSGAVTRLEPFHDGKHPHGLNADFSLGQAQALTLYFKGDPDNAPGALFAQLTTVVPSGHTQRVLYDGDPEDLMLPDWKEWNISLHDLSTGKPADPISEMGLPITKIKDIGVGVIGAGGGVVYFDDLRLNPLRCVPEYGPAKDLDDDCDVDEGDLRILIGDWAWQSNPGVNGVRYEYYEDYFDGLNDFDARANTPTRSGVKANFDISGHRGDGFGYRFIAQVAAPEDGYYNFHTSSDDGSKLYIDGIQVVDNDGFHGMQWRSGTKYLTAGLHDIMVTMFEWGGGEGLQVEVDGPGIPRMPIPNEVLFLPDAPEADLNGDGIVNFLDYADILNSFVDAVLFPEKLL
jgi:hypothetical protein